MSDKNGFPHFMLKEIFEQPKALAETIAPRVSLEPAGVRIAEEVRIPQSELRELKRINIVASGTSRHAGIVGQHIFQELVRLPVEVDYASEFENRNPLIGRAELTIVITQSGETADTTGAQREAKKKGSRTIAISNAMVKPVSRILGEVAPARLRTRKNKAIVSSLRTRANLRRRLLARLENCFSSVNTTPATQEYVMMLDGGSC